MKFVSERLSNLGVALTMTLAAGAVAVTSTANAQNGSLPIEVSVLGGVQGLLANETALEDDFVNIPVTASVAYQATEIFAVEGEFAWLIPVENSVSVGTGTDQDLKSPDILTYQANVRATLPLSASPVRPYVTAGAGAMTFLSTSDTDRYPQMAESQTAFAANFGVGAQVPLSAAFSLRADFREFVAFPQDDAVGLSNGSSADEIWMPRGTLGLSYQF